MRRQRSLFPEPVPERRPAQGDALAWDGERPATLVDIGQFILVGGVMTHAEHRIVAVDDKGAERGAVVHTAHDLFDEGNGQPLASFRSTEFLRDDGGFGGFGTPLKLTRPLEEIDHPVAVCDFQTSAQAALLYRQASRDYMPIHADPDIARNAGFDRPISHGLNTFGLACRAVLKRFQPRRPEAIASMATRFAARPSRATRYGSRCSKRQKACGSEVLRSSAAFWCWIGAKWSSAEQSGSRRVRILVVLAVVDHGEQVFLHAAKRADVRLQIPARSSPGFPFPSRSHWPGYCAISAWLRRVR